MTAHLIRIAWAAALCLCLGLALYVGAETIAASGGASRIALALALVLSAGLLLIASPGFVEAWRSGEMHEKTGRIRRTQQPIAYAALMTLHGVSLVALAAIAAYCATRLMGQ